MPDAVEPTLPDDAIEAAARAMHEAQNPPVMITRESARIANARRPNEPERRIIRIALAAAYPMLRAHIETELRSKIASEIEAHAPADRGDSDRAPDYRDGVRSGYLDAADIARRTADVAIGWPLGRDAARVARGEQ